MAPRLEIRNLVRSFGRTEALCDLSLVVNAGQVTCLLGQSGCGKSTALRIIAGVEAADSGQILVDGVDLTHLPPERRGVGLMFQDFALFPHLKVGENVAYGLRDKRTARPRVEALLARVGLSRYIDAYPHSLSGGEQQRVALVRALAPGPAVMLMDEPFSGLDERLRDAVRDETLMLLREEGAAVLLVTHDPAEAMRMADEIALMRAGRIVQQGAPYNIYTSPVDVESARFFSDINVISGEARGALVDTSFGPFLAPGYPDGSAVDIVIRPQHVRIDFNRATEAPRATDTDGQPVHGAVVRSRFLGNTSSIDFALDNGQPLTATVPGVFMPKPGTQFYLSIPRRHCRLFRRD